MLGVRRSLKPMPSEEGGEGSTNIEGQLVGLIALYRPSSMRLPHPLNVHPARPRGRPRDPTGVLGEAGVLIVMTSLAQLKGTPFSGRGSQDATFQATMPTSSARRCSFSDYRELALFCPPPAPVQGARGYIKEHTQWRAWCVVMGPADKMQGAARLLARHWDAQYVHRPSQWIAVREAS